MMAVELVTGFSGTPHVTAAQAGALNAAVFGEGMYAVGKTASLTLTMGSANAGTLGTGDVVINGRHVSLTTPTSLTFANGAQGMKRHDLVVIRYTRSASTSVESAAAVVVRGTPTSGTPADPAIGGGTVTGGSSTVDMPLFRVPFSGIAPGAPVRLFEARESMEGIERLAARAGDFVVSQGFTPIAGNRTGDGTAFGWIWRKWDSGVAEAWGNIVNPNDYSVTKPWGGVQEGFYMMGEVSYPFAFREVPVETAQLFSHGQPGGCSVWAAPYRRPTTTKCGQYGITRATEGTVRSPMLAIHAVGRWR
ncbi:hypothetical protein HLV35_07565 [Eggerthellaceae bacterium zg-997]|nr:hypothetical protein [Eggerthellaceae bacterium zg-997]